MIACFDVHYHAKTATAAAIVIPNWMATEAESEYTIEIDEVGEYQPGEFYKRELGPLLELIKQIKIPIQYYVIDAYCHLQQTRIPVWELTFITSFQLKRS